MRREQLAVTLDEIGIRVHPKTIIGDAKAKVASTVDQTAGRAFVAVNRVVSDVKARFTHEDGAPPGARGAGWRSWRSRSSGCLPRPPAGTRDDPSLPRVAHPGG